MKVTALGVHSAFAVGQWRQSEEKTYYEPKWQSNFLLEFEQPGKTNASVYRLVIDFGGDIRHSLSGIGLKMANIDGWYCSHPHADHIGGMEGIALSTFFHPAWNATKATWLNGETVADRLFAGEMIPAECKPDMIGHREVLEELWKAAAPGLQTLQGLKRVSLDTYFNPIPMRTNIERSIADGTRVWKYYTIESTHVVSGTGHMPCFGLMFESSDGQNIYFPTDTLLMMPPTMESFYRKASVIYQDCETGPRSGVHSHFEDIRRIDPRIKGKCYLYHFSDAPAPEPGEFKGVLRTGETHLY